MTRKIEKHGKFKNVHVRTWNMARKLKIMENKKYTLQDGKYGDKTEKGGKFRYVHCRTWNMARKLKIMENKKHPLDDLKNDEISKNLEK